MNVQDIAKGMSPNDEDKPLVKQLVDLFTNYEIARNRWDTEIAEIASFVFATDTKQTTNAKLPFHNTTTIPKLAHIRNNLVVSYTSQLMPNHSWIQFVGDSAENDSKDLRMVVEGYVRSKATASNLEAVVTSLVSDWIDTGVVAAQTRYVTTHEPSVSGAMMSSYSGPEAVRIDPKCVFWDVSASSINEATKVIKQVLSLGDLKRESMNNSGLLSPELYEEIRANYVEMQQAMVGNSQNNVQASFRKAGFGDLLQYYSKNQVELLTFYGTFYDLATDTLYENYRITVCNRKWILNKSPISEWSRGGCLHISIYETRHGCLAPISPLARIVGLQYKVDKLENLRGDVFDRIANPPIVEIGDVQFFGTRGAPGARYTVTEGGDVKELVGSASVLQADMQIMNTMAMMDDLSGNPKEALGTRTPGEKTKFEVQILDQGQNRAFRHNMRKFEIEMLNPILNDFINLGRSHLDAPDIIEVFNGDTMAISDFVSITKEQLAKGGSIRALGASIFSEKANILQTIASLMGTAAGQLLSPHIDRVQLAKAIEYLGDLSAFKLFLPNIGVQQDAQTRSIAEKSMASAQETALTDSRLTPGGQ